MEKLTVLVMAAGMGSRFGGLKQMEAMDDEGNTLLDYSVKNAMEAGFSRVVFVIRRDFEALFKEKVGSKYEGKLEVAYAFQDLDDLPEGVILPPDRTKPWGTGHAVRAARNLLNGPFAVINADDYYGKDGFVNLAAQFASRGEGIPEYALVCFELASTLSEAGTVSRGVCFADENGYLDRIVECGGISLLPNGNVGNPSAGTEFAPDTLVSVNFFGFDERFLPMLEEKFEEFFREPDALSREFFLPKAMSDLSNEGRIKVRVVASKDPWFGMTYREDLPSVKRMLREIHG